MAVTELGKPYNCKCQHQLDQGCSRYDTKPANCGYYECLWLAGECETHPKESGILYSLDNDNGWWVEIYEAVAGKLTMDFVLIGLTIAERMQRQYQQRFGGIKIYRFGCRPGVDFTVAKRYDEHKQVSNSERSYISRGTKHGHQAAVYVGNHPKDHDATEDIKQTLAFWAQLESCGSSPFRST